MRVGPSSFGELTFHQLSCGLLPVSGDGHKALSPHLSIHFNLLDADPAA
jgi:hypothetical protein